MKLSKQEAALLRETLGRCLEEFDYKPEITFAEHELSQSVRECLDILGQPAIPVDEDDPDYAEHELDFHA